MWPCCVNVCGTCPRSEETDVSRVLPALTVFTLVLGCGLVALFVPLPLFGRVLLIAASAFVATGALMCLTQPPALPAPRDTVAPASAIAPEISPRLRHDLRGLIAPAMLTADQLALSPDETTRTRAKQILAALDRMTERLKSSKS